MPSCQAKILIIDFDIPFVSKLAQYLDEVGYKTQCIDSEIALTNLIRAMDWTDEDQPGKPDLVIMELKLGFRSGLSLLIQLKALAPNLPIVLSSAEGGVRDVVDALRKGVDDYLLKPLEDFSIVARVIEKALRRGSLERAHEQAQADLKRLNTELRRSMDALERDQTAGRLVQEQFLPPSPVSLGGVDVSFEIIPSLYLSGDSIDYGFIGGRYLAFYLTDVSGHGSASAFVTVWIKQLVRGMFRSHELFHSRESFDADIPRLMQVLNEELLSANIGPHLTCFVGVIDTETLEMNYVVGGHLPLPLLLEGGRAKYLPGRGKPLGLFKGAEWQVSRHQLQEDFTLVVFSDGVLELFESKALDEKESELCRTFECSRPTSIDELKLGLPLQNRDTVPDDVAMLLLRRCAS